jgi:hypothetical protein
MGDVRNRLYWAAAALLVFVIGGIIFVVAQRSEQAVDTSYLDGILTKTAHDVLPEPKLTAAQIRLTVSPGETTRTAERVIALTAEHGGTAVRSPDDTEPHSLLVRIPAERAGAFQEALSLMGGRGSEVAEGNHGNLKVGEHSQGEESPVTHEEDSYFIEVIIQPGPTRNLQQREVR